MPKAADLDATLRDRALYLPGQETLVVADLHLGKVAASPIEAPMGAGPSMVDRVSELVAGFEPAAVVLAGDLLHSYGFVPRTVRETLGTLLDRITASGAEVIVLEGNHDPLLDDIIDRDIQDSHIMDDGTVICHGHELPSAGGDRYVIGHDHPAIEIQGRRRPCYLHARDVHEGCDVLALPAFNPAVRGTVVNGLDDGDPLSPFLTELSVFHPVILDPDAEQSLVFPRLEALRPHL